MNRSLGLTAVILAFGMGATGCDENRDREDRPARTVSETPPPAGREPDPIADLQGQQTCGGTTAAQCGPLQFCQFPLGICGEGNATGTCIDKPAACSEVQEAVCGCDNKTYGNECKAWAAGVNVRSRGECKAQEQQPKPQEAPESPERG